MSVSFISGRTKDSVHLVYKDHRFSRDRTRNDTIYWRCMLSRKTPLNPIICKARISTDKDGNIISVGQSHNHPPNKLEIQIRTCISDIKRLGELHENDKLDMSEKNLLTKLVENFPAKDKLKSERRKYRLKVQRQDQNGMEKLAPGLSCSPLAMGIPSRTMPTFSLAHLSDNNHHTQLQLTKNMKPIVVEPKVSLPPLLSPGSQLPLQTSTLSTSTFSTSTLSTSTFSTANSSTPHPSPHASPEPTASMFVSLEKELLNLLDVEELSKLMPLLSSRAAVDRDVSCDSHSLQPIPWAPEIERLFSEIPLGNPIV